MQLFPSHYSILQILDALVSLDSLSAPSFQLRELPRLCLSPPPCVRTWKPSLKADTGNHVAHLIFLPHYSGITLPTD